MIGILAVYLLVSIVLFVIMLAFFDSTFEELEKKRKKSLKFSERLSLIILVSFFWPISLVVFLLSNIIIGIKTIAKLFEEEKTNKKLK